ncbi:tol-pal system protein YbgF [Microvirga sp. W0021]|uniref:Cell division coordinator CpoB n=1 Tax=Hohaiivirga grylli TaxID=3133970 RepID=A0ABV0BJI5_9HYPH
MFYRILPAFFILLALACAPAKAQEDQSDIVVRMSEMEQQVRQMTGQIEMLQHENQQLKDQLRALGAQPAGVGGAPAPAAPVGNNTAAQTNSATARVNEQPVLERVPVTSQRRMGDVFDPASQPDAPGAPRALGTTEPSRPLSEQEIKADKPSYQMPSGAVSEPVKTPPETPAGPGAENATKPAAPVGPSVAATGSGDPKADYDAAYTAFTQTNYQDAEMGFRQFLQSHPRDERVPDAMYWLGETYLLTDRAREAGEQFLAISKLHANSSKAPAALLKLGSSLVNIGAADRACAIFSEALRKYPKASASYRDEVVREQKRANCP